MNVINNNHDNPRVTPSSSAEWNYSISGAKPENQSDVAAIWTPGIAKQLEECVMEISPDSQIRPTPPATPSPPAPSKTVQYYSSSEVLAEIPLEYLPPKLLYIALEYLEPLSKETVKDIAVRERDYQHLGKLIALDNAIAELMGKTVASEVAGRICVFIESNPFHRDTPKVTKKDCYLQPNYHAGLPRPLQYGQDGAIYIHFTKQKTGDKLLGKGGNKKVKLCLEYNSLQWFASGSLDNSEKYGITEVGAYKAVMGVQGFIQMKAFVHYQSKKGKSKTRIVTPLYSGGDLYRAISNNIDPKLKLKFARDLILAVGALHAKGLLHRDLKPENCFIQGDTCVIGDLGSICQKNDAKNRSNHCTTPWWVPPEYAKALLAKTSLVEVTTEKNDIWALGLILYEMFYHEKGLPWAGGQALQKISHPNFSIQTEPAPRHTLVYLMRKMLRVNPNERATAEELIKEMGACPEFAGIE